MKLAIHKQTVAVLINVHGYLIEFFPVIIIVRATAHEFLFLEVNHDSFMCVLASHMM